MAGIVDSTIDIFFRLYVLATGFAVGGFIATSFSLMTGHPLRFEMSPNQTTFSLLTGAAIRLLAGPFIIMRNTLKAVFTAGREPYWVMMAVVIASFWSFCQGILILETACRLTACA